ncbi:SseB family protein [Leucobacter iarius]|uniref:SseB family protein n=1 Tax=Leucobacter iarius TaxID=333963 RepID=A0ABP4XQZ3_9MICO
MAIKKLPSTGDAPRSTGVPESLVPGGAGDSAGFPWAGRTFDHHETAFADDDGTTPAETAAAIDAVREAARRTNGVATAGDYWDALAVLADAHADAIAALGGQRFLVPMLAEAGDLGVTPEGRTVEKTQELSIVTVAAPDGRTVLPIFSSTETLSAWNPQARPIPVPGVQAAVAAAQEGTDLLMIDPGTPEREFGVRRTALEAFALRERVLPAWADPDVARAFAESAAGEPMVEAIWLAPGDLEGRLLEAEVDVRIRLAHAEDGVDRAALAELLQRLQQRWTASVVIAERVDSLRVRPISG